MEVFLPGIIFVISGLILRLFPPKTKNHMYGYRTSISMKNKDTWDYSQKYGGISMVVAGVINTIISAGIYIMAPEYSNDGSVVVILLVTAILMLIWDETHIKKVFNSDGSRK